MKIKEIIDFLELEYPLSWQYEWDNSGLQVGDPEQYLTGILVAIDTTEEVLKEALNKGCNLIVTHHPLLFRGLKKITKRTYVERCVAFALKHDIVLYALHTNLDNAPLGVNGYWAERMGLKNVQMLDPLKGYYYKLVTYVPTNDAYALRSALMAAGVGRQGTYDGTSFSVKGEGRFRPLQGSAPHVGEQGKWHTEAEELISVLCEQGELNKAIKVVKTIHPYEEPAIDVVPIEYTNPHLGCGVIGDLPEPLTVQQLFTKMRSWQPITSVAHSDIVTNPIKRVAYGGGACRELIHQAHSMGADIFITGEAKYNDYYDAQGLITLATIGHYESEQLTEELLLHKLSQKRGNFALCRAESSKNPISYC